MGDGIAVSARPGERISGGITTGRLSEAAILRYWVGIGYAFHQILYQQGSLSLRNDIPAQFDNLAYPYSSRSLDPVALHSNLDKSARSKLDRSGSWKMEDYERERTVFGRAMEKGDVAV